MGEQAEKQVGVFSETIQSLLPATWTLQWNCSHTCQQLGFFSETIVTVINDLDSSVKLQSQLSTTWILQWNYTVTATNNLDSSVTLQGHTYPATWSHQWWCPMRLLHSSPCQQHWPLKHCRCSLVKQQCSQGLWCHWQSQTWQKRYCVCQRTLCCRLCHLLCHLHPLWTHHFTRCFLHGRFLHSISSHVQFCYLTQHLCKQAFLTPYIRYINPVSQL